MDERNRNGEAETEIREAYRREVLKGMEDEILRRTVKKAEVITRSMRPEEKEAYFGSQAFLNALKDTHCVVYAFGIEGAEAFIDEHGLQPGAAALRLHHR